MIRIAEDLGQHVGVKRVLVMGSVDNSQYPSTGLKTSFLTHEGPQRPTRVRKPI
jgi:hypothetical protein